MRIQLPLGVKTWKQGNVGLRLGIILIIVLLPFSGARVCDHLLTSDLPSLHGHPSPNLTPEAYTYLHHLQQLLEEHRRDQDSLAFPD